MGIFRNNFLNNNNSLVILRLINNGKPINLFKILADSVVGRGRQRRDAQLHDGPERHLVCGGPQRDGKGEQQPPDGRQLLGVQRRHQDHPVHRAHRAESSADLCTPGH